MSETAPRMRPRRIAGRVVSGLCALACVATAYASFAIASALPSSYPAYDGSDYLEGERDGGGEPWCDWHPDTSGLRGLVASAERAELTRACDAYRSSGADTSPERASVEIARAGALVQVAERGAFLALLWVSVALALAALLGALGLGRLGAMIAIVPTGVSALLVGLAVVLVPSGLVVIAAALASAPWGEDDRTRRPRDATAAVITSLLLVPPAVLLTLAAGWAADSYHLERRLTEAVVVAALGWALAGVPTLVYVRRAQRVRAAHPDVGGDASIMLARVALFVLTVATAAAIGHSFVPPP